MPNKTSFIFCLHNHQPEGNFENVFEEAYQRCYLPTLELLERHPNVKVSQHFTGILLKWLDEHHTDLLDRYRTLIEKGQVEFLTGGFHEPILASIPDRDKIGQIQKQTEWITQRMGRAPSPGCWQAERIWEPHLPAALAQAGIRFLPIDDAHFKINGMKDEQLTGPYVTEEQGHEIIVFPSSERLRYLIPFEVVEHTIDYLRSFASPKGENVLVMADDGEKFGVWPGTYGSIWEEGWLEEFFTALEAHADCIETMHFETYLERHRPRGTVYLPTASYREMMTWALNADDSYALDKTFHEWEHLDEVQFLRGGFWRNFLAKYPESNNMHKKMLWVGERIEKLKKKDERRKEALDALWAGQCNCGYWHGVFGGLYLNHIRAAVYKNLITAQAVTNAALHENQTAWTECERGSLLKDGCETVVLSNPDISLLFNASYGASLLEMDLLAEKFNALNTLTRRKEAYHKKLLEMDVVVRKDMNEAISIHNMVIAKEEGLKNHLCEDWYRRAACIDHFLADNATLDAFRMSRYGELGDFVNQPYTVDVRGKGDPVAVRFNREGALWYTDCHLPVRVEKTVSLAGQGRRIEVQYAIENQSDMLIDTRFGSEWGFSMNAGHTWDRCYRVPDVELEDCNLDSIGELPDATQIGLVEGWLQFEMRLMWDVPTTLWRFPIETISSSEGGFERSYQSSVVMPVWNISLQPGETWQVKLSVEPIRL